MVAYEPFPRNEFMTQFKSTVTCRGPNPTPDQCIMEIINKQLKVSDLRINIKLLYNNIVIKISTSVFTTPYFSLWKKAKS